MSDLAMSDLNILAAPPGYRTATLCGAGATSRVYRALEVTSGHTVALKRLHRELVRSPEALARLRRELAVLSQLSHPSIVRVLDLVRWEGDPTIVMDFVEGIDLKEQIVKQGPLPLEQVERIARVLLDVLATTHAAGIVHRDVKPQNVRLGAEGGIFLLDFGSARLDASSQLTRTGTTVGTPEYMPPELFVGPVYDPRVDVYGVGATLFECLAGRPPQSADSLAELAYLRSHEAIAPVAGFRPDVSLALAQVVDRCLARQPEDRYATASLALWALDHPELERRWQARRANLPLCVHCHAALAPESSVCPACKEEGPFQLAAGSTHVEIESVEHPARLIERIVVEVPERSSPDGIAGIAEHCAALSTSKQRFASFVDPVQAERLVGELREIGVRATAVREQRLFSSLLLLFSVPLALAALILSGSSRVLVGLAIAGLLSAAALDRGLSWLRARRSILADSALPKPVWPALQVVSGALLVATLLALAASAAARAGGATLPPLLDVAGALSRYEAWAFPGATMLLGGCLLAASIAASAVRLGGRPRGSPEPPSRAMVFELLRFSLSTREVRRSVPQTPSRRWLLAALFPLFLALVPFELYLLLSRPEQPVARPPSVPALSGAPLGPGAGPAPQRAIPPRPRDPKRGLAFLRPGEPPPPRPVFPLVVGGSPVLLLALSLLRLARRTSRLRRDAASIVAELDLARLSRHAARPHPRRRPDRGWDGALHVAQLQGSEGFTREAIQRAADLAQHLPATAAARLAEAVIALEEQRPSPAPAESALLARCLMETDPAHGARLRFLALEGQLEAQAAEVWASSRASER